MAVEFNDKYSENPTPVPLTQPKKRAQKIFVALGLLAICIGLLVASLYVYLLIIKSPPQIPVNTDWHYGPTNTGI